MDEFKDKICKRCDEEMDGDKCKYCLDQEEAYYGFTWLIQK